MTPTTTTTTTTRTSVATPEKLTPSSKIEHPATSTTTSTLPARSELLELEAILQTRTGHFDPLNSIEDSEGNTLYITLPRLAAMPGKHLYIEIREAGIVASKPLNGIDLALPLIEILAQPEIIRTTRISNANAATAIRTVAYYDPAELARIFLSLAADGKVILANGTLLELDTGFENAWTAFGEDPIKPKSVRFITRVLETALKETFNGEDKTYDPLRDQTRYEGSRRREQLTPEQTLHAIMAMSKQTLALENTSKVSPSSPAFIYSAINSNQPALVFLYFDRNTETEIERRLYPVLIQGVRGQQVRFSTVEPDPLKRALLKQGLPAHTLGENTFSMHVDDFTNSVDHLYLLNP